MKCLTVKFPLIDQVSLGLHVSATTGACLWLGVARVVTAGWACTSQPLLCTRRLHSQHALRATWTWLSDGCGGSVLGALTTDLEKLCLLTQGPMCASEPFPCYSVSLCCPSPSGSYRRGSGLEITTGWIPLPRQSEIVHVKLITWLKNIADAVKPKIFSDILMYIARNLAVTDHKIGTQAEIWFIQLAFI